MSVDKLYVGISGKMGSGKTTLTNGILEAMKQVTAERVSLAAPIKALQDKIYKELQLEMEGEKDRDLLIALGMWGRNKNQNLWLEALDRHIKSLSSIIVICDDIRFENEADFFREKGMLMRLEGEQRGDNVDHNVNDKSETALDEYPFDVYINNQTSVEDMIMQALYAIARHMKVNEELMAKAAELIRQGG